MSIDEQVMFYRPEEPDKKASGRLVFNKDGGRAELFGDLGGPDLFLSSNGWRQSRRLVAESQKKRYTLDGCYFKSGRATAIGPAADTLTLNVQTVIEGIGFEAGENLAFTGINVSPRYLERWSPKDWLSETLYTAEQEKNGNAVLKVNHVEPEIAQINDLTIKLGNSFSISGDCYEIRSFHNRRFFEIIVDDLTPFGDLTDIVQDFQDIVSIGTGRIAEFDNALAYYPAAEIESASGKTHRLPLTIYRRWRAVAVADMKAPEPDALYFNYEDLGGVDGVGR